MGANQPRRLSRREFLGGALGLAAAASLSSCRRAGEALGLVDRTIPGELLGPNKALGHRLREGGFAPPQSEERVPVVIVGAGVAGLSAGWKLLRSGMPDFVVLDLEAAAGGNSAWGENEVSAYPWGAHYLPVPGPDARAVREILTEFKILLGVDPRGRAVWDESTLCHAPEERLYLHGRWQEGLFPRLGATPADLAELRKFLDLMRSFRNRRGRDGKKAFTIPIELSSRDPELLALDAISMADWFAREGFSSARLRWYVEYACRDDFGATLEQASAWAGIHYFAARGESSSDGLLVWPEGNGRLTRGLAAALGPRVRAGAMAYDVAPHGDGVRVDWFDAQAGRTRRIVARRAIVCVPRFVARRIAAPLREDRRPFGFAYAPWMTANLTITDPPPGIGADPAWDNVLYNSDGLGYVDARHQSLSLDRARSVWTYYRPLLGDPDARRREAFSRSLSDWRELCLADLERGHPGLRRRVTRLDAWVWGHGMVMPKTGFVWGAERREALKATGPIHYAHSDLSGISLFEEANYRGVAAAEAVLEIIGKPFRSSL
jgi:phytoene dehydrogenase-like protein